MEIPGGIVETRGAGLNELPLTLPVKLQRLRRQLAMKRGGSAAWRNGRAAGRSGRRVRARGSFPPRPRVRSRGQILEEILRLADTPARDWKEVAAACSSSCKVVQRSAAVSAGGSLWLRW